MRRDGLKKKCAEERNDELTPSNYGRLVIALGSEGVWTSLVASNGTMATPMRRPTSSRLGAGRRLPAPWEEGGGAVQPRSKRQPGRGCTPWCPTRPAAPRCGTSRCICSRQGRWAASEQTPGKTGVCSACRRRGATLSASLVRHERVANNIAVSQPGVRISRNFDTAATNPWN